MNQSIRFDELTLQIKSWARSLGFQHVGVTDTELSVDESRLMDWLSNKFHGEMTYMHKHGRKRSRPNELVDGTLRVISARMNYWPSKAHCAEEVLNKSHRAYIARYALGRDYHKVVRLRLRNLANRIATVVDNFGYRVFVDSAPVLEKPLARKAGLGWVGKHTNLISRETGSWFFLGEIYTDLPLTVDNATSSHCGSCRACIDICPTNAIVAPYKLDARRCISYLTIEHKGSIPIHLRTAIGNRVFGCDDCQLVCPWNRYAQTTEEPDFQPRHQLDDTDLVAVFSWDRSEFDKKTEGSAIRRVGWERWLRNVAIALGNAKTTPLIVAALRKRLSHHSELVREHVSWALSQHGEDL